MPSARSLRALSLLTALLLSPAAASAFCGFYVARADATLWNEASQVVLARDGERTVLTMASDYRGDPAEFALVVPVPTFLRRDQIRVGEKAWIDRIDAFTAPRLVEYFDDDPCAPHVLYELSARAPAAADAASRARARALGVAIEAQYAVGEYDVLILSAKESDGLVTWLREQGYRLPDGAERVVGSYLKQGMRFFVAKVNLEAKERLGTEVLRPLQMAFETKKFMLPIRLGTLNAAGAQELFVYTLTRTGRVEPVNYRTVRLPSDVELPVHVKDEFPAFYRDMFRTQVARERGEAVFLEYAWDMGWCDPCAADPLTPAELRQLGVMWLGDASSPAPGPPRPGFAPPLPGATDAFVTRLHVRYDAAHFPEDLVFQETGDRTNFQGRYVLRHAWTGTASCPAAEQYRRQLGERREREARTLASLTGWDLAAIRAKLGSLGPQPRPAGSDPWWRRVFGPQE
jgi:hypothetical protein